jgi:asparagine synthetase B (glutamine-hydrolysing)
MCGIFGISKKELTPINFDHVIKDIENYVNTSQKRGSDTFGLSFKLDNEIVLYKANEKPLNSIKRKNYIEFLNKFLKSKIDKNLLMIGQTRLVTNGSKFSYFNNQPLETQNIVGVHNGIFTNLEEENLEKTKNYESYDLKSDSLLFFENISKLSFNENFLKDFFNYLKSIIGNFSIAFYLQNENKIFISSNCGSLFYYYDNEIFTFASEKEFIIDYLRNSSLINKKSINEKKIKKCLNEIIIFDLDNQELKNCDLKSEFKDIKVNIDYKQKLNVQNNLNYERNKLKGLNRCSNCILPETYPFIKFNSKNVCNYCENYEKQKYFGEEKLFKFLESYRSKNGEPDCLVGLSGGRDSTYGLHLLKTKYKMNPIAYTFDWGLTTDVSRINAAKVCGKLGVEHIIRSADIEKKREYVKKNLFSWLKRPHLGMLPIIQVGDKGFYDHGRKLSKKLNLNLVVHCTGYQLEQREFFLGFAGIKQKLKNNQRMYSYDFFNKFKMLYWYSLQFILNPHYFNSALIDNFDGFLASFVRKDDFLHLYNYEPWNEKLMTKILNEEYSWTNDVSYGKNQWRMGDGQTAFNNFVYYTLAGFSEYDNFRSNQIREGLITRSEAIKLCDEDNKIKYDTLKNFSEVIGFNLDNVLSKISSLDKLY